MMLQAYVVANKGKPNEQRQMVYFGEYMHWAKSKIRDAIASQAKEAAPLHSYLARFPEGEHQSSAQLRLRLIQKGAIK